MNAATTVRLVLRVLAIAIAIAGLIDPAFMMRRRVPVDVAIRAETPAGRAMSDRVRGELTRALGDSIRIDSGDVPSDVILIGRPVSADFPERARVSTVSISSATPNVWMAGVSAPERVLAGHTAAISATVRARGMVGTTSAVVLEQQGVALARVEHKWATEDETFAAAFTYAPAASGLTPLRVAARASDAEVTADDNAADFGVLVDGRTLRVLTYEPRPSWTAAFVRRALESDPTFEVAASVRPSRGVDVTAGDAAPIRAAALERFDAVVVGAPEELTSADVEALETFTRRRGGALVILPDRRPSGSILRLLPVTTFDEVLLENAVSLNVRGGGKLRASEFALPRDAGASAVSVATLPPRDRPAVFSWPAGSGRILFGGALDAWRYRAADDGGFATFWRAVSSAAALMAPSRVDVTVQPSIVPPNTTARVVVTVRETEFDRPSATRVEVPAAGAEMIADDGSSEPVRLWPSSEAGRYEAVVRPSRAGRYSVRVTSAGATTDAIFVVLDGAAAASPDDRDVLAALAAARSGRAASVSDLSPVVEHLRRAERPAVAIEVRPLQSAWWMLPFASALCAEWAIRRRGGLR